jgi:hypothetical protein
MSSEEWAVGGLQRRMHALLAGLQGRVCTHWDTRERESWALFCTIPIHDLASKNHTKRGDQQGASHAKKP